jgi:hypothetical protein
MRKTIIGIAAGAAIAITALLGSASTFVAATTPTPTPAQTLRAPFAICGGGDGYSYVFCGNATSGSDHNGGHFQSGPAAQPGF